MNISTGTTGSTGIMSFSLLTAKGGRRYSLTVKLHLSFSGSLKDYLFFKDNVYACLNLFLTRDVDLECL
jgi:hypothetical protein